MEKNNHIKKTSRSGGMILDLYTVGKIKKLIQLFWVSFYLLQFFKESIGRIVDHF